MHTLKSVLRKMTALGIEWTYHPGVVYTGMYKGFNINIRYAPAAKQWRLYVNKDNGGSLAFSHQFHATVDDARKFGKNLVDEKTK